MRLNEKLGVIDGSEKEAIRFFDIVVDRVKNADLSKLYRNTKLLGKDTVDVGGKKIVTNIVIIIKKDKFPHKVTLSSLSLGRVPEHKIRGSVLKTIQKSDASFIINVDVGNEFKFDTDGLKEIKNVILSGLKVESVAHELKHLFDLSLDLTKSPEDMAQYKSVQFNFPINAINRFLYLLYFMSHEENSVRPSELYQEMLNDGLTKEGFREFMKDSRIMKVVKESSNFSIDKLREDILKDPNSKKLVENCAKNDGYKSIGGLDDDVLNITFVNIVNTSITTLKSIFEDYITGLIPASERLLKMISGLNPKLDDKTAKILDDQFKKFMSRYVNYIDNPGKFFQMLEKKLNFEGDKMNKKLYKLYDMLEDKSTDRKSILNWEIYNKSKNEKLVYTLDFEKFNWRNPKV